MKLQCCSSTRRWSPLLHRPAFFGVDDIGQLHDDDLADLFIFERGPLQRPLPGDSSQEKKSMIQPRTTSSPTYRCRPAHTEQQPRHDEEVARKGLSQREQHRADRHQPQQGQQRELPRRPVPGPAPAALARR